ncbi:hypothetical protein Trydic_g12849 [Trypoxylus dichotomus]
MIGGSDTGNGGVRGAVSFFYHLLRTSRRGLRDDRRGKRDMINDLSDRSLPHVPCRFVLFIKSSTEKILSLAAICP